MHRPPPTRDAAPQWALVGFLVVGLCAGLALGALLPAGSVLLLAGLTSGAVAATGSAGPPAVVAPLARWAAASTTVAVCVGFVASGRPVFAALAMAAVAVFTSASAALGPVGIALGTLSTLTYVLALLVTTSTAARDSATVPEVVLRVVLAAALGAVVALVGSRLRTRRAVPGPAVRLPAPWRPIWNSVTSLDAHARDGLRRALPLALLVLGYQYSGSHDAMWVLISALAVLLPTGRSTAQVALVRVLATLIGVGVVVLLAGLVPLGVIAALALVAMVLGLAYQPVHPVLAGAASAFAVVVLVGVPTAELTTTGLHRLIDTLAGAGIALAANALLWPRDSASVADDGPAPVTSA